MNLASIIDEHPSNAVAVVSRGRPTTYGELRDQVAHLRGGFAELGLVAGDRIALVCGNNWYFAVSYLAALGVGLVVVPLNPSAPGPELTRQLAVTGARAVVVSPAAAKAVATIDRAELPELEHVVDTAGIDLEGATSLDELMEAEPMMGLVPREDDDLAVLVFTSGTAGAPRAAMLTHGNLLANLRQIQSFEGRRQQPEDVSFGVLPLSHIFGLNVVLGLSLYAGSSVVLVERFDPSSSAEAIERHGVTVIAGVPTMWAAWASLPGLGPDTFSTVRIASSGAAKLPVETAQLFEDRFDVRITEGYGLTESSPVATTATGTDAPWGSIGAPLPGVEVRLVDADGEDVLIGDAGELWLRGPNVFIGYWGDPEATERCLSPEGWYRTGDVAVVDDHGHLYLVDRVKDIIIVSGFNVFPAEVEEVLNEHPAVDRCAVVGVPHPHSGEAVKAYVMLEDGRSAEEDDIVAWCSDRLARYKCPDKVMFVDELPIALSGKLVRRELR
ncbi:MAG: AMP-binding protein [Acidimicrobiia bacterium]|nr:AMP-binding protein [Acidimicrobiia bacterium]